MPRARPLILRPGVRFHCFGDGICCSDVHALGPIRAEERRRLRLHGEVVGRNEALGIDVLQTTRGRCVLLDADTRCSIYDDRPRACRRFPLRLVATPLGGRVITEHRCPCRTLGDRPLLTVDDAARVLMVNGRLQADDRVSDRIELGGQEVSFADYVSIESALNARILAGDDPIAVLGTPFPTLRGVSWSDVGHLLRSRIDGSAGGEALAMAGDVLLIELGVLSARPLRARPWAWAFDRAEGRATRIEDPARIEADFAADALFSLDWVQHGSLAAARALLATELTLMRAIAARLVAIGVRPDRAMAEAALVIELAFASSIGGDVARSVAV